MTSFRPNYLKDALLLGTVRKAGGVLPFVQTCTNSPFSLGQRSIFTAEQGLCLCWLTAFDKKKYVGLKLALINEN